VHIGMILSAPLPPTEGIGFYAWNLTRQLVDMGHRVTLITRGSAKPTCIEVIDGIPIWRTTFLPVYPLHVHLHGLFVDRLLQKLEPEVDIWHLHSPLVKFPKTHRPTLVTIHTPMKADTGEIPVRDLYSLAIRMQGVISQRLEREIHKNTDHITAVSNSVADELGAYGIPRQSVEVIGNGADTRVFQPGNNYSLAKHNYFLTAGRLAPRKGLEDLIHCAQIVMKDYSEYHFVIAGDGPLKNELKKRINDLGLQDYVQLIGHVSDRNQMADLYRGALAYIHPAHYEGLPTVLLEAMACARPVIATAVSGALDVIKDRANGLLVPPREPEALAKTIQTLLETPGLGDRLGAAACETIRTRYSWDVVSLNYLAQYQALLGGVQS
jgi:glycosyltransferase involved in cell wall biosynthesis